MNLIIELYNTILYQPLFNFLVLLYQYLPGRDFGVAVIFLTILIKLILHPLMVKSIKSQKLLAGLQVKIQEIQKNFKNDRGKQSQELIKLYQKEKINPLGSFLFILIQLPILVALYQVFWKGLLPETMANLYSFVSLTGSINPFFLGIINLSQPNLVLAVLAGICQFFQSKMMTPRQKSAGPTEKLQKQMLYFFPVFTILILFKMPSAIGLYWLVNTLFSIGEQHFILKKDYARSN